MSRRDEALSQDLSQHLSQDLRHGLQPSYYEGDDAESVKVQALKDELARLKATAQTYPTMDIYEAAVAALDKKTIEAEELREELEREHLLRDLERKERDKAIAFSPEVAMRYELLKMAAGSLVIAAECYGWVTTGKMPREEVV